MKKLIAVSLLVLVLGILAVTKDRLIKKIPSSGAQKKALVLTPTVFPHQTVNLKTKKALFVPYWGFSEGDGTDLQSYDKLIYFGILSTGYGVNKEDEGYKGIAQFKKIAVSKASALSLRMTNQDENEKILENPSSWDSIVAESIDIAKQNNFDELLLDLELAPTLNSAIQDNVSAFVEQFFTLAHNRGLMFSIALYGDTFYRKRPYNVAELAKYSDKIYIMAYDLHKDIGEPGPNFPLKGKEKWGYDLDMMMSDFETVVDPEKLTVIFGLFGHEWAVDEKKRPVKPGTVLSYNEIRKKFIDRCEWQDCVVKRDELSGETEIDYIQSEVKNAFGYINYHIVWVEDPESVEAKIKFFQEKGIGSVAYWARGYF